MTGVEVLVFIILYYNTSAAGSISPQLPHARCATGVDHNFYNLQLNKLYKNARLGTTPHQPTETITNAAVSQLNITGGSKTYTFMLCTKLTH